MLKCLLLSVLKKLLQFRTYQKFMFNLDGIYDGHSLHFKNKSQKLTFFQNLATCLFDIKIFAILHCQQLKLILFCTMLVQRDWGKKLHKEVWGKPQSRANKMTSQDGTDRQMVQIPNQINWYVQIREEVEVANFRLIN